MCLSQFDCITIPFVLQFSLYCDSIEMIIAIFTRTAYWSYLALPFLEVCKNQIVSIL